MFEDEKEPLFESWDLIVTGKSVSNDSKLVEEVGSILFIVFFMTGKVVECGI
jgi:hypothetical protein